MRFQRMSSSTRFQRVECTSNLLPSRQYLQPRAEHAEDAENCETLSLRPLREAAVAFVAAQKRKASLGCLATWGKAG